MFSVLTLDWYVSQIARLHLNAFRVDLVRPVDFDDMDTIMAASVTELEGAISFCSLRGTSTSLR
jgi:hypothetical protein